MKTVPLDEHFNVPWMWSASVFDALPNVTSDDEGDDSDHDTTTSEGDNNAPEGDMPLTMEPKPVTFAPRARPDIIPDDTIRIEETVSPQQEYLAWHH